MTTQGGMNGGQRVVDEWHCPRCGKLKRTRSGAWHKCGPTDREKIAALTQEVLACHRALVELTQACRTKLIGGRVLMIVEELTLAEDLLAGRPYAREVVGELVWNGRNGGWVPGVE